MTWNPAAVRARENLKLTDSERQTILKNFEPLQPGELRADGVFEGGGVLGIAFLGALRCCEEIGLRWCDLAGTSAGAITATLLAADYSVDELDALMGGLDYMVFLSEKTSRLILTGDPSDDIGDDLPRLLAFLYATRQRGEYSSEPFYNWLDETLQRKDVRIFSDVIAKQRMLKVVASDISRALMLVIPDSLTQAPYNAAAPKGADAFEIAAAVRLSMSIPLFFDPGTLAGSTVVDGGITSNFPLWIYDSPPGERPHYPTFGFRLMDTQPTPEIHDAVDVLKGMISTMRFAHDRFFLQEKEFGRVINIDLTGVNVSSTKFNLTDADKDVLYMRGYESARAFFRDKWSWARHLAARGFASS